MLYRAASLLGTLLHLKWSELPQIASPPKGYGYKVGNGGGGRVAILRGLSGRPPRTVSNFPKELYGSKLGGCVLNSVARGILSEKEEDPGREADAKIPMGGQEIHM